jgi:phosphoglycolate phosphatase
VRLAVLSNKPHEFAELMVRELMADVEFEIVLGHRDGAVAKPDPAGALGIAAEMGIEPSRFLYVGDTDIDMMTGRSAGMFTVGVLWGFRDRAELLGAGAEALAEKPMDLVRLAEKGRC